MQLNNYNEVSTEWQNLIPLYMRNKAQHTTKDKVPLMLKIKTMFKRKANGSDASEANK